jgi:hypothetical protein
VTRPKLIYIRLPNGSISPVRRNSFLFVKPDISLMREKKENATITGSNLVRRLESYIRLKALSNVSILHNIH